MGKYDQTTDASQHETPRPPGALEVSFAVIIACAFGGLLLGSLLDVRWEHLWRWGAYGMLAPLVLLVVACIVYLGIRSYNAGMWSIERRLDRDLDGDGAIGEPGHLAVFNADAARADVASERYEFEKSVTMAELLKFVDKCAAIGSTSETAHGVKPNTEARKRYVYCRDLLMQLHLAEWKSDDPRAGWQMTVSPHKARQVIAEYVAEL
jgi:hypothetical protein